MRCTHTTIIDCYYIRLVQHKILLLHRKTVLAVAMTTHTHTLYHIIILYTAVVVYTSTTTKSWASGRASADASTTAAPSVRPYRRRQAAGWCTACRLGPARARRPASARTERWPRPPRDVPRACPSPVAPVSSCTCGSGTRFSPETMQNTRKSQSGCCETSRADMAMTDNMHIILYYTAANWKPFGWQLYQ